MTVAVVVPYFQRAPGILARALKGVEAQTTSEKIRVMVVDDQSPISAKDELDRLGGTTLDVHVIAQANAGPAAARNRALDALDASIDRVAFLDSDDVWDADHLANAARALDAGHDFYFADFLQLDQQVSAFERAGRLKLADHPRIDGIGHLHSYSGDMFDQVMRGNVIGTSTVVYDFRRFGTLRFDEAFYSAGEDYLFWISCAKAGARFCFSSSVEVRYEAGVNVYSGSGWGTEGYMRRIQNEMRYRKRLLALDLNAEQEGFVRAKIGSLRRDFVDDLMHRVSHRKPVSTDLLKKQWQVDAPSILLVPMIAGQLVADRIKGKPRD